ncbi:2-phosphosulfolactate phosphatase [Candidatus Paracaedibacter symbiosus]|uniref:2-phosphosulfolactate phosphatase n=1 Tax=Candidatus Paracaedibacter symbiosus TaxID=244582 RepID=UPI0005094B2F|nr:2-phosphosulfolactate phosphatase [Candidatus Paracaedibacter symbiosus]
MNLLNLLKYNQCLLRKAALTIAFRIFVAHLGLCLFNANSIIWAMQEEEVENIVSIHSSVPINFVHKKDQSQIIVIIDAFRAFTTASYVLENHPASYTIAVESTVISRLSSGYTNPLLIGKPEKDSTLSYNIPNSPTRVLEMEIKDQHVFHRTAAGARGLLLAREADIVLAASFANIEATAQYIKNIPNSRVSIIPMGHEATTPSLEDNLCAEYLKALLKEEEMNLTSYLPALREGSGAYFFSQDQWQYPREDFDRCLKIGQFNFAIQALVQENYATLRRID